MHGLGQTWPMYMGWAEHGPNAWAGYCAHSNRVIVCTVTRELISVHSNRVIVYTVTRELISKLLCTAQ